MLIVSNAILDICSGSSISRTHTTLAVRFGQSTSPILEWIVQQSAACT